MKRSNCHRGRSRRTTAVWTICRQRKLATELLTISPNGRTLLFATYGRPDSYGDVDIYVSRLEDGKWGKPLNLGPCVNTAAPEFHPTVLWDREELYFVRVRATTDFFVTPLQLPK